MIFILFIPFSLHKLNFHTKGGKFFKRLLRRATEKTFHRFSDSFAVVIFIFVQRACKTTLRLKIVVLCSNIICFDSFQSYHEPLLFCNFLALSRNRKDVCAHVNRVCKLCVDTFTWGNPHIFSIMKAT